MQNLVSPQVTLFFTSSLHKKSTQFMKKLVKPDLSRNILRREVQIWKQNWFLYFRFWQYFVQLNIVWAAMILRHEKMFFDRTRRCKKQVTLFTMIRVERTIWLLRIGSSDSAVGHRLDMMCFSDMIEKIEKI